MKTLKRNIMTVIFVFWVLPDMKTSLRQTDAGCNTVLCISHFTCISVLSISKLEQNSKILNTDLLNLIWSWAPTSSKNHRFHWKKMQEATNLCWTSERYKNKWKILSFEYCIIQDSRWVNNREKDSRPEL